MLYLSYVLLRYVLINLEVSFNFHLTIFVLLNVVKMFTMQ